MRITERSLLNASYLLNASAWTPKINWTPWAFTWSFTVSTLRICQIQVYHSQIFDCELPKFVTHETITLGREC